MTPARLAIGLAGLAALAGLGSGPSAPVGADAPAEHRVAVFTDSVGLGAKSSIPAAFPADWEVNVDGQPARFVEQLENDFVKYRLAVNPEWFGDHVVIAGGYNYPYWDPERFDRSIDSIITTLTGAGVQHVYWVTLREIDPQYISGAAWRQIQPYYWYFPTVNEHLERALDRHPNLTLVDWAAIADRSGITYDAIHLNTTGAALYASLIRTTVETTATRVEEGSITRVPVPDPDGVAAVAVNLTTTQPRRPGFLTAFACDDDLPDVSSHNFVRNQTVAHATIVPLGPSGEICVHASSATNLIVDLTGRFTGELPDRGTPVRLVDTREAGQRATALEPIEVDVPPGAAAYTVTAIGATERSWVRLAPCDDDGTSSNVNAGDPAPVPNAAVARPGADGTLCLTASAPMHLLLDRLGPLPGDGLAVDGADRVVDTRADDRLGAGEVLRLTADELGIDPADGAGALVNLTGLNATGPGFVTAYGCADGRPGTSNLNVAAGTVVANLVAVAPDAAGELCVYTTVELDLLVDLQGRAANGFTGDARRLLDTRD